MTPSLSPSQSASLSPSESISTAHPSISSSATSISTSGTTAGPAGPAGPAANSGATPGARPGGGTWRMVVAMLLSGTIGLVVVESGLPVEWVVLLRCVLGALGLGAWLWWRHAWVQPGRSDWYLMAVGGAALVGNWVALFHAYAYVGISVATVVYHVQPFLLVLAAAVGGEAMRWRQLPWMLLALGGVVLSSGVGTDASVAGAHTSGPAWWGVVLTVLAASLYTLTVMATRRVKNIAPAQIAMVQMLAGGALLALWMAPALWTMVLQGLQHSAQVPLAQTVVCVLIAGLVHTSLMYGLMYGAFQRLGAAAIAMLSFIYPAVALLVDLWWFGAHPAPAQWLGMALIVVAVMGYRWQELRQATH